MSSAVKTMPSAELVALGSSRLPEGMQIEIRQSTDSGRTAIVCMHGIGSNAAGYAAQLAGLSDRYRVIAWNAPGYGRSTNLADKAPAADDYAHALAALLDALKIDTAVVIGSSFGGVIAAYFGALYPEKTLACVLSAPAAGNVHLPAEQRKTLLEGRINDMKTYGPKGVADRRCTALVAPGSPDAVVADAHALVAATHPEGYYQAAHVLDSADTVAIAGKITAPTLVLVGTEDKVTPAETCARPIHAALANGELHVLKGIGHLIKLEAPEKFNALVSDFLARNKIT